MVEDDERFQKILKDPRFKKISKKEKKVKIDSRFQHMFTDDNFQSTYTVDKRGKPIYEQQGEDLEKFYELDSEEEEKEEEERKDEPGEKKDEPEKVDDELKEKSAEKKKVSSEKGKDSKQKLKQKKKVKEKKKKKPVIELAEVSSSDDDGDDGGHFEAEKGHFGFADIRGKHIAQDASSSESEDEAVGDGYINRKEVGLEFEDGLVHGWGELDANAKRIENAETCRLAFCNCDWDKITATDIFVLCNSFKPAAGGINSVTVYPSDFGLERMKEEDLHGPMLPSEDEDEDDGAEDGGKSKGEGSAYHMEKLREYQLNRMKYFYAVVECDSEDTANMLYEECDGMEYEMSATRLDIRFIPNDTTFDDREPHSVATELPSVQSYQPATFLNTALQQSTVRLTWDETDQKRKEVTSKQFSKKDIEEMDFKEYMASSSSEEDDDNGGTGDDKADKYKALMDLLKSEKPEDASSEEEGDMEVTFEPGMTFGEVGGTNTGFVEKKGAQRKKKKASAESDVESDGDADGEQSSVAASDGGEETVEAFSDDVDAPTGFDDPFFNTGDDAKSSNLKKKKKKKKKKVENEENMTEEEKKQKTELELLLMRGEEEEQKKHFSLKSIVENEKKMANKGNKRKKRKNEEKIVEDDFKMDVQDDRFAAIYDQHAFALDPSQHHFKKTKATDALFEEAQRRKKQKTLDNESKAEEAISKQPTNIDSSLSSLVKSVKAKAKSHHINKKKTKIS